MNRWIGGFVAALAFATVGAGQAAAAGASAQLRWFGDTSSATGNALGQGRCDVNGDGYDDAVAGAWFWDKAPTNNIGAAYVLFGGPAVNGGDLNVPGSAGAARIDGPSVANSFVGFAVGCLGDVNNDGIDDIGIGHHTAQRAYVVFGAEEFGSPDLGLLGERGFVLKGSTDPAFDANVGNGFGRLGDLNGDGFDDFALAGNTADSHGRTNNGRVWIVSGQDEVADIELFSPQAGEILATIDGADNGDQLGLGGIAPAGDVDGDGQDDILLGAYSSTPWGDSIAVPGSAWVIRGGTTGEIDLADLDGRGFAILGPKRQRDRLGIGVSGLGDVNGDGRDDLLIGGDGVSNPATGERDGSAWVVFGSDSLKTVYTHTNTASEGISAGVPNVYTCEPDVSAGACTAAEASARGYWIQGADTEAGTASESHGYSVSGIGDINADDVPDMAVGAWGYDPVDPANPPATMSGAGAVWVVHGKADTTTLPLSGLPEIHGYRIDGLAAGDRFGRQVAGLGDIDGNGVNDWAAAGEFAGRPLPPGTPRSQAGEVMVALMGELTTEVELQASAAGPIAHDGEIELAADVIRLAAGGGAVQAGSVSFRSNGRPIAGCDAVPLDGSGHADCAAVGFPQHGEHQLVAAYSGVGGLLAPSSSDPLALTVSAPPAPPTTEPPGKGSAGAITRIKGAKEPGGSGKVALQQASCANGTGGCTLTTEAGRVQIGDDRYGVEAADPRPLGAGRTTNVRIRLKRAARRALAKEGRGSLILTSRVEADGHDPASGGGAFTVRPAKKEFKS